MADTQTYSLATSTAPAKLNVGAPTVVQGTFNLNGTTATAATATTINLCKIPNRSTITRIYEYHTGASGSMPVDLGVNGDVSAFASAATIATATTVTGLPYDVSVSDDAADQFKYLTATVTPGTTTATMVLNFVVEYVRD